MKRTELPKDLKQIYLNEKQEIESCKHLLIKSFWLPDNMKNLHFKMKK